LRAVGHCRELDQSQDCDVIASQLQFLKPVPITPREHILELAPEIVVTNFVRHERLEFRGGNHAKRGPGNEQHCALMERHGRLWDVDQFDVQDLDTFVIDKHAFQHRELCALVSIRP
jgi:hypothetical protein